MPVGLFFNGFLEEIGTVVDGVVMGVITVEGSIGGPVIIMAVIIVVVVVAVVAVIVVMAVVAIVAVITVVAENAARDAAL